jgi:hypothetical protein
MLPLRFDDIGSNDVLQLVEARNPERKTLEYKAKLNISTGDEKAEFLADISSFANASGGDIIFGISDQRDTDGNATGIPDAVVPLSIANPDSELGRISQIIEAGIQPRIPAVQVKVIPIPEVGPVVLIRIPKSWVAPHMVSFANRTRFYSRNNIVGKMQLDVQQIGAAFAAQRSVGERLRDWKTDRISKAVSGEGPVQLEGPKMLFHFISAAALTGEQTLPRTFETNRFVGAHRLISLSTDAYRYNADGLLMSSRRADNAGQSYLQIFREGHLEYADSYALDSDKSGHIASGSFEEKIQDTFERTLPLLKLLEVAEPIFASLTLVDVKGLVMWLPQSASSWSSTSHPFDRGIIVCPDMLMQNLNEGSPYPSTLLPIIDAVWQAAGRERTPYLERWKIQG